LGREAPQITRLTEPIGQAVAFRDDPGQAKLLPPKIDQRPENVLDRSRRSMRPAPRLSFLQGDP
jgi:hypothetical protein